MQNIHVQQVEAPESLGKRMVAEKSVTAERYLLKSL